MMTWQAFSEYFSKTKHSGYKPEALRMQWEHATKQTKTCDDLGIVDGVKGHGRWRIELEDRDDSVSESESADEREHVLSTKPGEASMQDVLDFSIVSPPLMHKTILNCLQALLMRVQCHNNKLLKSFRSTWTGFRHLKWQHLLSVIVLL